MSQIIGNIIVAGLLVFCLLALIIPVLTELKKVRSFSPSGNRTVALFMTIGLLAVLATYLLVR